MLIPLSVGLLRRTDGSDVALSSVMDGDVMQALPDGTTTAVLRLHKVGPGRAIGVPGYSLWYWGKGVPLFRVVDGSVSETLWGGEPPWSFCLFPSKGQRAPLVHPVTTRW